MAFSSEEREQTSAEYRSFVKHLEVLSYSIRNLVQDPIKLAKRLYTADGLHLLGSPATELNSVSELLDATKTKLRFHSQYFYKLVDELEKESSMQHLCDKLRSTCGELIGLLPRLDYGAEKEPAQLKSQSVSSVTLPPNTSDDTGTQNMNLVKKHIEQQGSLPVRSLKSFLIGPPHVGKTTARRRLTGEITNISPDEIVPSTGIEAPLTVQLLYDSIEQSSVVLSTGWRSQGLEELCRSICSRVLNTPADPPAPSNSSSTSSAQPSESSPQSSIAAHSSTQHLSRSTSLVEQEDLTQSTKDDVTTALTALVTKKNWGSIRKFLKKVSDLTFLQIIDVGGQPEFHEILPLLLHGLALNLIFLNVTKDLDSPYRVVYRDISGPSHISYDSEFTIREVIQRVLCSISSLQKIGHHKPTAILIGTHLDLAKPGEALDLEKSIQESFKDADFLKNDVLCPVNKPGEKTRYIHPLDNVSEDSTDIEELRELITRIVHQRFRTEEVPTGALLLLLILRMKFDPHPGWCSVEDCVKIAECCGISKKDLLKKNGILDYLHNRFGTVLFFREVEGLRLRVIVNANIIMGPPSELFVHAFGTTESEPETAKRIRTSGEISHDLMNRVCSNSKKEVSDNKIPTQEIVGLLESLYILYKDARSDNKDSVYFLPSVLSPDPDVVKESSDPCRLAKLPYSSLLFLPSSGFVPLGHFSATVVKLSKNWRLDKLHRSRNRIRFYFQQEKEKCLHVELRTLSTYFEFRVLPQDCNPINPRLMIKCREELYEVLSKVTAAFPHMKEIRWEYGFYCPHALQLGGRPHAARCLTMDEPHDVVCSQEDCRGGPVALENKHKCWFMDVPVVVTPLVQIPTASSRQNKLDTKPDIATLNCLKYTDTQGETQRVFISMEIAARWRDVGISLHFTPATLDNIESTYHGNVEECCKRMLNIWLEGRVQNVGQAPVTWKTFLEALKDARFGQLANNLTDLLTSHDVKVLLPPSQPTAHTPCTVLTQDHYPTQSETNSQIASATTSADSGSQESEAMETGNIVPPIAAGHTFSTLGHHPLGGAKDIMKKHYENIHSLFQHDPPKIARKLFCKEFIDQSVRTEVTNVQNAMSNESKADILINAVEKFFDTHTEPDKMLETLLDIFDKCGPLGRNVTKRIRNQC